MFFVRGERERERFNKRKVRETKYLQKSKERNKHKKSSLFFETKTYRREEKMGHFLDNNINLLTS